MTDINRTIKRIYGAAKADMITLLARELGVSTDTEQLYLGNGTANKKISGFATATELTISGGTVTITGKDQFRYHTIDTESDAASDPLTGITGGNAGELMMIRAAHTDRTVVCTDGAGFDMGGADISLDDTDKTLLLACSAANTWHLIPGHIVSDYIAKSIGTAAGDIIYWSAASTPSRLAKGDDDDVLTLAAGVPSWAAIVAGNCNIEIGDFTGDGTTSQVVSLTTSETPKIVIVFGDTSLSGGAFIVTDQHTVGYSTNLGSGENQADRIIAIAAGSFTVDDGGTDANPNKNGVSYGYIVLF